VREQQRGFTNYVNFGTEGLCCDLLSVALKPFDYDLYRQMANKSTSFHEKCHQIVPRAEHLAFFIYIF